MGKDLAHYTSLAGTTEIANQTLKQNKTFSVIQMFFGYKGCLFFVVFRQLIGYIRSLGVGGKSRYLQILLAWCFFFAK